jgi:hypothetical protein
MKYQNDYENEDVDENENLGMAAGAAAVKSEEELLRDYLKIRDGDTEELLFSTDPKKRRVGTKDFGKGPTDVMWFTVSRPDDPQYEMEYQVTSKQLMKAIVNRYLKQGKTLLEISRKGSRQDNTEYRIRAVDEDKVLVITSKEQHIEHLPLQEQSPQQKRL